MGHFRGPLILATAFTCAMPVAALAQDPAAEYRLSWTDLTFPTAHVEAQLRVDAGRLQMFPGLTWALGEEHGWASNVRNLTAADADGAPLDVELVEGAAWTVGPYYDGRATITYDVDFSFATRAFETGNEQIAWLADRALFSTGFALFVYSETDAQAVVRISTPTGWSVATPWPERDDGTFWIDNTNDLIRNVLTVGTGYGLEALHRGGMTVDIALMGGNEAAAPLIRQTFEKILDYYLRMFDFTSSGHFLIVVLPGPNDGEGYMTSFASSQPDVPSRPDLLVWANSMAHEFFHYWNGSRISSVGEHYAERQWFSEGFTEYYANLALRDEAIIDERRYAEILGHYLSFHLFFATSGLFDDVSPIGAGRKKGLYRPGVYDSGVAIAFCLDGSIRERTEGRSSLADMMRTMDRRFGAAGRPIEYGDIVQAASETAGADLSAFFSSHVADRVPLPVEQCADRMGYRALVDGYHVYLERRDPDQAPVRP